MPVIVVANPKGGAGKSTLATNLAGYYANQGYGVLLGDIDRQQSSRHWLERRPVQAPAISTWEMTADDLARPPAGTSHVILDTPAGLCGSKLERVLQMADRVLVPLLPSMFDIDAAQELLVRLETEVQVRPGKLAAGIVGMRVDSRTKAAEELARFTQYVDLPVLGHLRDTQNYVRLAAHGLTLWDIAPAKVRQDLEQWGPIVKWIATPEVNDMRLVKQVV